MTETGATDQLNQNQPRLIRTIHLPHSFDRLTLMGKGAITAEDVLEQRKQSRADFQGIEEPEKHSFTGSADIFEKPDGTKYTIVRTDWVDDKGKGHDDVTSFSSHSISLTDDQYQTLIEGEKSTEKVKKKKWTWQK